MHPGPGIACQIPSGGNWPLNLGSIETGKYQLLSMTVRRRRSPCGARCIRLLNIENIGDGDEIALPGCLASGSVPPDSDGSLPTYPSIAYASPTVAKKSGLAIAVVRECYSGTVVLQSPICWAQLRVASNPRRGGSLQVFPGQKKKSQPTNS